MLSLSGKHDGIREEFSLVSLNFDCLSSIVSGYFEGIVCKIYRPELGKVKPNFSTLKPPFWIYIIYRQWLCFS